MCDGQMSEPVELTGKEIKGEKGELVPEPMDSAEKDNEKKEEQTSRN